MTSVVSGGGSAPSYEYEVGAPRVFIVPANKVHTDTLGDTLRHDWPSSAALWVEEPRLIPVSGTRLAGSIGAASFRLLRRTREDNGVLTVGDPGKLARGCYIAVSVQESGPFDPTKVQWWGWVTTIDAVRLAGADDEMGSVTAQELGGLLDSSQLTGWSQAGAVDPNYPEALGSPPSANISLSDSLIIGNCKQITPADGASPYVFARTSAECAPATMTSGDASVWTRYRLLSHIVSYCKRANVPRLTPSIPAGVQAVLDDTAVPELFDLVGLTLKGALDMLIPRARGFGWHLVPKADFSAWEIIVYSHDPDGSYLVSSGGTKATNAPVTVTADAGFAEVATSTSAADEYDQVVIRGERHVHAVTVSVGDGNLDAGWRGSSSTGGTGTAGLQEDLYRQCTGVVYPTSPTTGDRIARNTEFRQSPSLDRVFTTYALKPNVNSTISAKSPPGDGAGTDVALVPTVSWDPLTKKINVTGAQSANRQPYLPSARLLRWIPWPKGVKADGTDTRDAQAKAQPEYLPPRLFRYLASPPAYDREKWINLLSHGQPQDTAHVQRGTPQVSADDRSLALRVEFSPPEILARGHWSSGDAAMSWYPLNPNDTSGDATKAIDWKTLVATVALESDQRVEVSKVHPALPGEGAVRRQLVIQEPGLKCWTVQKGAVLGVTTVSGGAMSPDRVTATNADAWMGSGTDVAYVTRCDYPVAQRMLEMVSAWIFRPRASATLRLKRPDATRSWATIGAMIGKIVERAADVAAGVTEISTSAYTVVESVAYDWGLAPTVTVSTTLVERPELPRYLRGGGASSSPAAGGAVSAQLGGTTAQAVASLQADVSRLERDTQRLPILPPRVLGGAATPLAYLQIIDGQTAYTSGATTIYGIQRSGSTLATVASLWDPNSVASTPGAFTAETGIGRATLYLNGVAQSSLVLVVLDARSPVTTVLLNGDPVAATTLVTIPLASDATQSVSAYVPLFV